MISTDTIENVNIENLTALLAQHRDIDPSHILIFSDSMSFTTELLRLAGSTARLVVAGHATAELAIAADRAGISYDEIIGTSPFSGNAALILRALSSPDSIVFMGNPNRVTGQNYSVVDLEKMVEMVPQGLVIVDEYYHAHFGISAVSLVETYRNVIVLGSFVPSAEGTLSETGYAVASQETIHRLRRQMNLPRPSLAVRRRMVSALTEDEARSRRLREINDESLRLATDLNRLGVQCRITATDFLLMRVKEPKQVGNFLARYKVPIENLTGYPEMKHYIRYRIASFRVNSRFIEAFRRMPGEYYRMKSLDLRSQKLRLARHASIGPVGAASTGARVVMDQMAGAKSRRVNRPAKVRSLVKQK